MVYHDISIVDGGPKPTYNWSTPPCTSDFESQKEQNWLWAMAVASQPRAASKNSKTRRPQGAPSKSGAVAVAEAFVNRHQSTSNLTDYISQSSERQLWQKTRRVTAVTGSVFFDC